MARVLGDSARYVSQETVKKRRQMTEFGAAVIAVVCVVSGFFAGYLFQNKNLTLTTFTLLLLADAAVVVGMTKFGERKLNHLEKERVAMRKGAVGEAAVAANLVDFPDDFYVINDLSTPFGNVDHVVVGSTGVFLIDTKNWRGVVAADGNGELLYNGQPTEKPMVRPFVGRLMGIKDQIKSLSRLDPYFQGVLVFTSARVDANWGTTGRVHCLRDDQLFDYIVEGKTQRKLSKKEIDSVAHAFLALARMDKEFKPTEQK